MFEFIIDYCKCTNYCKKAQDFVVLIVFLCAFVLRITPVCYL